jgi:DeoR family fructose operon transcriptional repressor
MIPRKRQEAILACLRENKEIETARLCQLCGASRETIRRDLCEMEKKNLLRRVHGGASLLEVPDALTYSDFEVRVQEHISEKKAIAEKACSLIRENQAIILDSGTTDLYLARALRSHFRTLTVITNSLAIARELASCQGITLIVTGGVYSNDDCSFSSDLGTAVFSKLHANIYFMTVDGIHADNGVSFKRVQEISIQKKMQACSLHTVALADHSKIGLQSLVEMCPINSIDCLVTDRALSPEEAEAFQKAKVEVVIADGDEE